MRSLQMKRVGVLLSPIRQAGPLVNPPQWSRSACPVAFASSRANSTASEAHIEFEQAPESSPLQQNLSSVDKNKILKDAVTAKEPRHNWTREQIAALYYQPLLELAYQAVSASFLSRK